MLLQDIPFLDITTKDAFLDRVVQDPVEIELQLPISHDQHPLISRICIVRIA